MPSSKLFLAELLIKVTVDELLTSMNEKSVFRTFQVRFDTQPVPKPNLCSPNHYQFKTLPGPPHLCSLDVYCLYYVLSDPPTPGHSKLGLSKCPAVEM